MKTAIPFLLLFLLTSCQNTEAGDSASTLPSMSSLVPTQLVRINQDRSGGFPMRFDRPQLGGSEDWLTFFLEEDGSTVITRYLGPGGSSSVRSFRRIRNVGDWILMERWVPGSEHATVVAKWRQDEHGLAVDVHLRQEPFYEWRVRPTISHPENAVLAERVLEWRPFDNGAGHGEWKELE